MITDEMVAPVGRLFKPHGYKGEINFDALYEKNLYTVPGAALFIKIDNILVPFFVEKINGGASGTSFLKLKGIDSDLDALPLVRKEVYALKTFLVEQLEITEEELSIAVEGLNGFEVRTSEEPETAIGEVIDMEEGVEYDYLIVEDSDGRTFHIPFIEEFIEEINEPSGDTKGYIIVSLPEGFLEI